MDDPNAEYFFVLRERDDRHPVPTPDEDTAEKPFLTEMLPLHGKPLIFTSGAFGLQKRQGITPTDPPPPILFYGSFAIVKDSIREALLPFKLSSLALQPAIFIDHKENWHEDYWFLTFLSQFDCWDRQKSTYSPKPSMFAGVATYNMFAYSLDAQVIARTPLQSRLLFKMGGTSDGFMVAHTSIAKHFRVSGAVLVPISDFGVNWP